MAVVGQNSCPTPASGPEVGRRSDGDGGQAKRTVVFVKVSDTVVNDELIRQGLAGVFARYCDRAICERWERHTPLRTDFSTSARVPPIVSESCQ
jgi:hypothetical protein